MKKRVFAPNLANYLLQETYEDDFTRQELNASDAMMIVDRLNEIERIVKEERLSEDALMRVLDALDFCKRHVTPSNEYY